MPLRHRDGTPQKDVDGLLEFEPPFVHTGANRGSASAAPYYGSAAWVTP